MSMRVFSVSSNYCRSTSLHWIVTKMSDKNVQYSPPSKKNMIIDIHPWKWMHLSPKISVVLMMSSWMIIPSVSFRLKLRRFPLFLLHLIKMRWYFFTAWPSKIYSPYIVGLRWQSRAHDVNHEEVCCLCYLWLHLFSSHFFLSFLHSNCQFCVYSVPCYALCYVMQQKIGLSKTT